MAAAAKKVAAVRKSKTESPDSDDLKVVNVLPTPKDAAAELKSPYPKGVDYWTYQPEDEKLEPIMLPLNGFTPGDKLWHFDLAQLPILTQTWRWMDKVGVPKHVQRQTQILDDTEYFAMFGKWFDAMKAGQAPKGSVTPGK